MSRLGHTAPVLATVGTVLGVLSKTVYECISGETPTLGRGIIGSLLVSPLVVMYTYSSLKNVGDAFLSLLIASTTGRAGIKSERLNSAGPPSFDWSTPL
jgi:hypothetical protein